MFYTTTHPSPVGLLTLASDGERLTGLWNEGQKYHGNSLFPHMAENDALPVFGAAKHWLARYFSGDEPDASELPLAPKGSEFRQGVWRVLCGIPYGEVLTYGDIAKKMAADMQRAHMSAQAIGGAVGHNPISIIIPCHRVVGADGSLTGYAGGIDTKIKLLKLEGAPMSGLFVPKRGTAL